MKDFFVSIIVKDVQDQPEFWQYAKDLHSHLGSHFEHYEIIFVDSCPSTKDWAGRLEDFMSQHDGCRYLRLAANSSNSLLINCGLDLAIGDYIVILTAVIDPISRLAELVERVSLEGCVLLGKPKTRYQSFGDKFYARLRNIIYNQVFDCTLPNNTSDYMVFNRNVLNAILRLRDRVRYVKAAIAIMGYKIATFKYDNQQVYRGGSAISRIFDHIDTIFSNSTKPLRWVALCALLVSSINLIYVLYVFIIALFKSHVMEGWITLSLQNSMNYFLISLALAVGFEYLWRGTSGGRKKNSYLIIEEKVSGNMIARQTALRNVVSSTENY